MNPHKQLSLVVPDVFINQLFVRWTSLNFERFLTKKHECQVSSGKSDNLIRNSAIRNLVFQNEHSAPSSQPKEMSQPWMEGLGQSVGGMLTAAPGGGTGSDKAPKCCCCSSHFLPTHLDETTVTEQW